MGGNSIFQQAFESLIDKHMQGGMTLDTAAALVRDDLPPEHQALVDEIVQKRKQEADDWNDLFVNDPTTVIDSDRGRIPWYVPPPDGGRRWTRLKAQMSGTGLAGALDSIHSSTDSIVKELAQPFSNERRKGLVVGNVQSGKTANYAALAAKALDTGYSFVIVLSGIHNNLRRQTQERLNRDLGVDAHEAEWHRLTGPGYDIDPGAKENAASTASNLGENYKMLAVMKKNVSRLEYLLNYLSRIDERTLRKAPILIIDDESDQATPDSSNDKDADPTTINRLMRQVWNRVINGTYVGYTATPFANVFMNPDDDDSSGLADLYPSDFIHVMPTPDNYFGAEKLFGIREGSIDAEESEGLDVIRRVPKDELPQLAPSGRADVDSFTPAVTSSLDDAIRWFIVASAIRRLRGQHRKHSSMLIHTTHRTRPHGAMRDVINGFLAPLKEDGRNGEVETFRSIFSREEGRVAQLYTGDGPAPTWPAVSAEIPNVLRSLKVVVDNGDEDESDRLRYSDDAPQTVIVIGGGTLARGLTLEGLFVSFFTRTSNTYDTLLQMGRWFGYRPGYEDLQRIWLTEGLDTDYQFLAQVEAELRAEIRRMTLERLRPRDVGVRVRRHPGRLQVTSPGKMKYTDKVEVSFDGYRTQTTLFDFAEPEVHDRNLAAAVALLQQAQTEAPDSQVGPRLFRDVPFATIKEFFDQYSPHLEHAEIHTKAIEWVEKNVPEMPWRVALANGEAAPVFEELGLSIKAVNRAPLKDPDGTSVNIRALMSGHDRVLDLILEGKTTASETPSDSQQKAQRQLPESQGGAGGQGLLILYPISRTSTARTKNGSTGTRADMEAVLKKINPDLAGPDFDSSQPIIGYGLVNPSDLVRKRGTYVAVTPKSSQATGAEVVSEMEVN